jgi:hypothetical protein
MGATGEAQGDLPARSRSGFASAKAGAFAGRSAGGIGAIRAISASGWPVESRAAWDFLRSRGAIRVLRRRMRGCDGIGSARDADAGRRRARAGSPQRLRARSGCLGLPWFGCPRPLTRDRSPIVLYQVVFFVPFSNTFCSISLGIACAEGNNQAPMEGAGPLTYDVSHYSLSETAAESRYKKPHPKNHRLGDLEPGFTDFVQRSSTDQLLQRRALRRSRWRARASAKAAFALTRLAGSALTAS